MPGLDPRVAVHKLKIDKDATPVKQAPRRMRVELEEKVTAETRKLIDAGFIRDYPRGRERKSNRLEGRLSRLAWDFSATGEKAKGGR